MPLKIGKTPGAVGAKGLARVALRLLGVIAGLYLLLLAATVMVMHQPPDRFGRVMKHVPGPAFLVIPFRPLWLFARAGSLRVGDPAPDFELITRDRRQSVRLSDFRGKQPVVLIFGSYT
jgi:hypothetical protein